MILNINLDFLEENLLTFYQSEDINKIKDALYHGFKIVHSNQYAINQNTEIKELIEENEKLQKNIENTKNNLLIEQKNIYEPKLLHLENTIKELKNNEYENRNLLEKEIEKRYLDRIESLEKDKIKSQNNILELIRKEKEDYFNRENIYKTELSELKQKLDEKNNIYSNSSKKGLEGETNMLCILNNLFPNADILDTHKETGNGDARLIVNNIQILYENKNFDSCNIPKRDLDKFRRDVELNDCHCGIICSERTGIASKNDLDIEIINNKPCIFLHNTSDNVDKIKIAVLILCNIIENKLDLTTSSLQEIKELIKELDSFNRTYNSNKKSIENLLSNNENLGKTIKRFKNKLKKIIE
jgi:hypothetical protein